MITFRRVLAIPRDIHAWLYRDRIAAACDAEHQHEQLAAIRADARAFDRVYGGRLDLYGPPLGGVWPGDLCAYPPCDKEDGWVCVSHKPAANGRNRIATVTDLTTRERTQ